jgi:UDP-N-acetylmuramoyl-tripeptide--D-alanyl-D-alanine ligase
LFVALKAERNGTDFLPEAASTGAIASLVQEDPKRKPKGLPILLVPDTRKALGQLAAHVRRQMTAKVIAVGGSNGKTGTKHLIDSALCQFRKGTISPKSFNNDIGVPLAIFPADPHQEYLVLEMGTNHHGELRVLTTMAQPDVAVITNCSAEHLEGLGDLSGVRREEASIIEGLSADGLLVVNGDDRELLSLVANYPGKRVTFGRGSHNDLFAADIECDYAGVHFKLNGRTDVAIPLLGKHTAVNSLAAIAVARHLGLSDEEIVQGLATAHGPDMRLQLQNLRGITFLNDAYNANPASMKAAIETLLALQTGGRRIAVLADMREMGDASDELHREMGRYVGPLPLDLLICVGPQANLIAESAKEAGFPADQVSCYANTIAAATDVPHLLRLGDFVLLKGSRAMMLEQIPKSLGTPDLFRRAAS